MLNGQCLCGEIKFQLHQNIKTVYQCHCSLCRKQSGTHANHATMINQQYFEWLQGISLIQTYRKASGFCSCFCTQCGSPVPNQIGSSVYMWIPMGLLESATTPEQRVNFCLSSKADWEVSGFASTTTDYMELPSWTELSLLFDAE